jgi:hypothetical protein
MHARHSVLAAHVWLSLLAPAAGQELRTNQDGSAFSVHLDPRARPRMRVDELIAFADEAERARSGRSARAEIMRIDLVSGAELALLCPAAPLQDAERWFWLVWLAGDFVRDRGPPESEEMRGHLGWALYDDEHRTFIAGGFRGDPPSRAPESQPSL